MDNGAEEDVEQGFFETMEENIYLSEVFNRLGSPELFLKRDGKIYARSTAIEAVEQDVFLTYNCDIDGCVVELNDLRGVNMNVRHLTFCRKGSASISPLKPLLGKHLDLCQFSKAEMSNFNNSFGFQLFYEGGWECYLGLIPRCERISMVLGKDIMRQKSLECFFSLKRKLQEQFAYFVEHNLARRTLMKNDLNDIGTMFILPDDSQVILNGVQEVLNGYKDTQFRLIIFCFRFGEKMTDGQSLSKFHRKHIRKVTAHAAVDISSDAGISLLWSMSGLQEVVGCRGVLRTCLSLIDCGTFQSNLDGRAVDVSGQLRSICSSGGELRFLQLYADIPHLKPKSRFHPISGCIAGSKCFTKPTADAFMADARRYLSALENNWRLFRECTCRIEFVINLAFIPDVIKAEKCVNVLKLRQLLEVKALLVPFPVESTQCIQKIGLWITQELRELFEKYCGTGNVGAIWEAYQLELASEKLIWGHPHCLRSNRYSINLGPGILGPSRCLSDYLGFLALEPSTSCMCSEESIPLCSIWSQSDVIGKRIQRYVGLHDHIGGSYSVIGRQLVSVLLHDLFEVGKVGTFFRYENFYSELKTSRCTLPVLGSISVDDLVRILSVKRRVQFPMVYGLLCQMLQEANLPLAKILAAGFEEMKLAVFPALEIYDADRHAILKWSWRRKFWCLIGLTFQPDSSDSDLSSRVKTELELRRLIFVSKLKRAPMTLPWIRPAVRKLEGVNLGARETINTLAFISCIAFIMQGWYVDYGQLQVLLSEMPVSQNKLRDCEILSKLILVKFQMFTLHRLHWSIPHKVTIMQQVITSTSKSKEEHERDVAEVEVEGIVDGRGLRIGEDEVGAGEPEDIESRTSVTCLPVVVRSYKRWTPQEVEMLESLTVVRGNKSVPELYTMYKQKCMEQNIQFRTLRAFEHRLGRLH